MAITKVRGSALTEVRVDALDQVRGGLGDRGPESENESPGSRFRTAHNGGVDVKLPHRRGLKIVPPFQGRDHRGGPSQGPSRRLSGGDLGEA